MEILYSKSVIIFVVPFGPLFFLAKREEIVYVSLFNCFQLFSYPFSNWLRLYLFLLLITQVLDNLPMLGDISNIHKHASRHRHTKNNGSMAKLLWSLLTADTNALRTAFWTVSIAVHKLIPYFLGCWFERLNKGLYKALVLLPFTCVPTIYLMW